MQDPSHFYDALAADYNTMTDAARQLQREQHVLGNLIKRLEIRRALEVGCGTGTQCFVLARLGVDIAGSDISAGMIAQARRDARNQGIDLPWYVEDCAADMHRPVSPYDAIFTIGNTLAHIPDAEALSRVLRNFRARLRPGGMVIIQLLNYARIVQRQERIINIRKSGPHTYVRFYDFPGDHLIFNILTITEQNGTLTHDLHATPHTPWRREDIAAAAQSCGFPDIVACGNLEGDPYEAPASTNLVMILK